MSSLWTSLIKTEEFQEVDVWEVFQETPNPIPNAIDLIKEPRLIQPAPNLNPTVQRTSNKNLDNSEIPAIRRQSAPVNTPSWSEIYGTASKNATWLDLDRSSDDDDYYDGSLIPPHELIARRKIASFSMCEGAGRTLKGRDLSRVRNAVLTKTGFLETTSNYY